MFSISNEDSSFEIRYEEEEVPRNSFPSTSASPTQQQPDWRNAMEQDGDGEVDNGSLHGSLNELSPVFAGSDILAETLSITEQDSSPPTEGDATPGTASNRSVFSQNATINQRNPELHLDTAGQGPSSVAADTSIGQMVAFEEKPPLELPTKTRLKVKIKRLKMVGGWRWVDGKEDACGICRTSFETCCMECKFPGDECPLVLGRCKHPFHMHCIVKWTNSQNGQKPACPLCRQEWKFATD